MFKTWVREFQCGRFRLVITAVVTGELTAALVSSRIRRTAGIPLLGMRHRGVAVTQYTVDLGI